MPEVHRLANLIPEMTEEQYTALVEDIGANGLLHAITLYQGKVLDGRHRQRAIEDLAERGMVIEPRYYEFTGTEAEAFAYVISVNLHRRHLEFSQRAALAAVYKRSLQSSGVVKHGGDRTEQASPEIGLTGEAAHIAAVRFGVSPASVYRAEEVLEAAPEVHQLMVDGGIELKQAQRQARSKVREAERTELIERAESVPASDRFRVFRAEIETLAEQLEPESIDAIITDPPYPREYLHLFGCLGELAANVLKPGGILCAMSGQSYLPDVFGLLLPHLSYHWTMATILPGAESPTAPMFSHKVNSYWKPILVFTKGDFCGDSFSDVVNSDTNDKRFHHWGQPEAVFAGLIERMTKPDALILDPFCGGGTTGVTALRLSRRVICTDVDPDCVSMTLARCGEVVK